MSEFFNEYVIIELKIIFIGINNIDNKIGRNFFISGAAQL